MIKTNLNFAANQFSYIIKFFCTLLILIFAIPSWAEFILYEDLVYKPRDKNEAVKHYVKFHKNQNKPFTGEAVVLSNNNKSLTKTFFENGIPKGWVMFSDKGKIISISYGSGYRTERDLYGGMQIYPRDNIFSISLCDINCVPFFNLEETLLIKTRKTEIEKSLNILNRQISQAEVQFDLSHNFFLKGLKNYLYTKKVDLKSKEERLSALLQRDKDTIAVNKFWRKKRELIDNRVDNYVNNLNKQNTSQNKEFSLYHIYDLLDIINQKI